MKGFQKLKSPHQVRFKFGKASVVLLTIIGIATGFILGYLLKPNSETILTETAFEQALVSRVIDGDTIELDNGSVVRYLGIDTPETNEYFFQEATDKNKELVEGKIVELQQGARDVDEYGRLLRYVYIDGIFVNAELVAQGYAKAYIFDPDDRYSQILVQLEQYAKMSSKGMWGLE
jgi:micrococcal nuclease